MKKDVIDIPLICLDDDDDNVKIDKDYKLLLDHLRDDKSLDHDKGESEIQKLYMSSCDSKRSMFCNERTISNRVVKHRKQRDNRVLERRKRKLVELEATRVSMDVPLVRRNQENTKARAMSESKVETLWDVPLVRTEQDDEVVVQCKRKLVELEAARVSRDVPLVRRNQENTKARDMSESKVETLYDVPLVRTQEVIQRDNNEVGNSFELKVETLRTDPLVLERRKKKIDETNVAETSRTRKKNVEESVVIVDKDYMSYLTWLVDALRDLTSMANPQNNLSDSDTRKDSTFVSEKTLLVKVKVEQDLESFSDDDDDIIAVSDSPLLDGESTPFVASKIKNVIDLEKENTEEDESSSSCWFKKKLMDVLEKPYNEEELLILSSRVSMKRPMIRCRELRKGRESSYETDVLGKSYLEKFSDFDEVYKSVDGDDKVRLELLRGFFFYLENVSQDGAFRPWRKKGLWV